MELETTASNIEWLQQHALSVVDKDTGEIIHGRIVQDITDDVDKRAILKMTNKVRDIFMKLYVKNNLCDIVLSHMLSLQEMGLLYALMLLTGWQNNYVIHPHTKQYMSCADLTDITNIPHRTLIRYLNSLSDKGLIAVVNEPGKGHINHYIVNTNLSLKGYTLSDSSQQDIFNNKDWLYQPSTQIKYRHFLKNST
jgi:hypothetical protein